MARNLACQWEKNSWQCAWGCGLGEIVRVRSWREFWYYQKKFPKVSRRNVVPLPWTRKPWTNWHTYWVTRRTNACRHVNILKLSLLSATHYPHPHASPRTLYRVLPSLGRQISCRGVNCLPYKCQSRRCVTLTSWH